MKGATSGRDGAERRRQIGRAADHHLTLALGDQLQQRGGARRVPGGAGDAEAGAGRSRSGSP